MTKFSLYIDETGSNKPSQKDAYPFFGIGGVLVKDEDRPLIEDEIAALKDRWGITYPLHGCDIRAMKGNFTWLEENQCEKREPFLVDLLETVLKCPIIIHGCVISRKGYYSRFSHYGPKTWEMLDSALVILLERVAKYVDLQGGTLMTYFEEQGKVEDRKVKEKFRAFRDNGHPFDAKNAGKYEPLTPDFLSRLLRGIDGKKKGNTIMQIADLCLYPIANGKLRKDRAFDAFRERKLLVDTQLSPDLAAGMGIKYYCFENA